MTFEEQWGSVRVVFGTGESRSVGDRLQSLGANRILFVCTERARPQVDALAAPLDGVVFAGARQHVPLDVAAAGAAAAGAANADAVVAFGGGSPIGLGKAIALRRDVLLAAVPTTYSGSEMTNVWGVTGPDGKRTGRDERVRPRLVIYDPELTYGMPVATSMTSGFNALAHAVEASYAEAVSDAIVETAERSIRALAENLPRIAADATDPVSRTGALYGAHLAGSTIAAGMAIHHKLCHVLGGSFALPHAPTHTVVLPHAIHYNRGAAPDAMARIAGALGTDDASCGVYDLQRRVGAPASLRELGLDAADLDRAAELATRDAYYNPRPIDRASVRALLGAAHAGTRPGERTEPGASA